MNKKRKGKSLKRKDRLDQKVERFPIFDIEYFIESFKDLSHFCSIIEKQELSVQILMKDHVTVRLVSLIEYNLKAFISKLIDDLAINPKRLMSRDPTISINLDVLQNFKSDQYTTGRIIIAHFDKMNPGFISEIMSNINRVDYFGWYSSVISSIATQTDAYAEAQMVFNALNDLYVKRNDVVHNLISVDYSVKELEDLVAGFKNFILHLFVFTGLNIGINESHWSETRQLRECDLLDGIEDLSKFLQGFKKITKKFREDYPSSKFQ